MSELTKVSPLTALGLGDANVDPEILTKEIDHDFFDDPPETSGSVDLKQCQQQLKGDMKLSDDKDVEGHEQKNGEDMEVTVEAAFLTAFESDGVRIDRSFRNYNESGRSSSNVTVEMDKDQLGGPGLLGKNTNDKDKTVDLANGAAGANAECFFEHQSNATSPNYPRPKQCYQLQQRRRSLGSIKKPTSNNNATVDGSTCGSLDHLFHPMNHSDCGLNGQYNGEDMISSSSSSNVTSMSSTDSDLSDSSESELESLTSDEDEFVDMLEKYFDYIDPDTDCSDLTEVSPLSSLSASPLPVAGMPQANDEMGTVLMMADMNLVEKNDQLISEAVAYDMQEEGLSATAADVIYDRGDIKERLEFCLENNRDEKPKLPVFISTTEKIIVGENGLNHSIISLAKSAEKDSIKSSAMTGYKVNDNKDKLAKCPIGKILISSGMNGPDDVGIRQESGNLSSISSEVCLNMSSPVKEDGYSPSASSTNSWSIPTPDNLDNIIRAVSSSGSSSSNLTSSRGSGKSNSSASNNGKRPPKNYTFTPDQLRKIERENTILLKKIMETTSRNSHSHSHHHQHRLRNGHSYSHHHHSHSHHHHKPSSASIARLRQLKRIECENSLLMKRLQTVRPSKEIVDAFGNPAIKN